MEAQDYFKTKRNDKEHNPDDKKTIRILSCVVLILSIFVAGLVVLLTFPKETQTQEKADAERFTGKKRAEIRMVRTEYLNGNETRVFLLEQDMLFISGEGYEKVAKTIEEQFAIHDVQTDMEKYIEEENKDYVSSSLEVTRMDERVISVLEHEYHSVKGGSYMVRGTGYNFDVKTGKLLELDDVLKEKEGFYQVIHELILEYLYAERKQDLDNLCPNYRERYAEWYSGQGTLPNWFFTEAGMGFSCRELLFFDHASGCTEIIVPYEELSGYLKNTYLPVETVE